MADDAYRSPLDHALLDRASPLIKQTPTVVLLAIAIILIASVPSIAPTSAVQAATGIAAIAAATVLAGVLTWRKMDNSHLVLVIPMVDILGIGLFRAGTGGSSSLFGAFMFLPVVWLAAAPGIRYVFAVAGLTSVALLTPYFYEEPANGVEWLRGVIVPAVYAVVAAIVNELSRLQRARTELAEQLAAERSVALSENVAIMAELRESEGRYRELLAMFRSVWNATTAQAVISTDQDGAIQAWNPGAEHLFGISEPDAIDGMRVTQVLSGGAPTSLGDASSGSADPLPADVRHIFDLASSGVSIDRTLDLVAATGRSFPARMNVTLRTDAEGAQLGYLLVVSDETRTAEVARMKDEFLGMVSHELRTPITSILGYTELMQDSPKEPPTAEQHHFLTVIDRHARRLLKLVGDLLFTVQVESGQFSLDLQDVDVLTVVAESLESAQSRAAEAKITFAGHVPANPLMLHIDPIRLSQALDNLVSNAIKFTPRGGHVGLEVREHEHDVTLTVRDSGLGIPTDEIGQLFTRFFRASNATRNAIPGMGLGLAITHAIITAHGGRIDVTSEEGIGTEFCITLPRAVADFARPSDSLP